MRILLDTANIELIEKYYELYDIDGVTSNPTILSRESGAFRERMLAIRQIIGNKELHVQIVATDYEDMLREADFIVKKFGAETYVKVPVNETGIMLIKNLKLQGYNVTATAIYTLEQAVMAASVGADYIAPYYNRMANLGMDSRGNIERIVAIYQKNNVKTQILAASFKTTEQITEALLAGAHGITAAPELYTAMVTSPHISEAIDAFRRDWKKTYGDIKLYEC